MHLDALFNLRWLLNFVRSEGRTFRWDPTVNDPVRR